jgi:hypothetical protein
MVRSLALSVRVQRDNSDELVAGRSPDMDFDTTLRRHRVATPLRFTNCGLSKSLFPSEGVDRLV